MTCIFASPTHGDIYAEVVAYDGPPAIEHIVNDEGLEWKGRANRHFVPISYYPQYMRDAEEFHHKYAEFDHFVFLENTQSKSHFPVMVDHQTLMLGEWICFLWKDGEGAWFPEDEDAQLFFYWLVSEQVQGLINDRRKTSRGRLQCGASHLLN